MKKAEVVERLNPIYFTLQERVKNGESLTIEETKKMFQDLQGILQQCSK